MAVKVHNKSILFHTKNIVTEVYLFLFQPGIDEINSVTSHGRLATKFLENSIETGKNHLDVRLWWKRNETELLGVPYLYSVTEKLEKNELFYDTESKSIHRTDKAIGLFNTRKKILALPEHFSHDLLKLIATKKLINGDKILIKCEPRIDFEDSIDAGEGAGYEVVLDDKNHIIHSLIEEEKKYTKEQIIAAYEAGVIDGCDPDNKDTSGIEWFNLTYKKS